MAEAAKGKELGELLGLASSELSGAKDLADQAFQIYEELGDRRGAMSSLISIAYAHLADPTPRGMAGRLEHVRRLHQNRNSLTTESQRAVDDALMLYSIHVFGRANLHMDLALERGLAAFEGAKAVGNRWLECLAAGGMALTTASLGQLSEAESWMDRAASSALASPRPALAYRMELWRGTLAGAKGDADAIVVHLERAADLAAEQTSPAGQCEALARLAFETARIGVDQKIESLLGVAESTAVRVRELAATMEGMLPWDAMAHAVQALVAHEQGRTEDAADAARSALDILQPRLNPTHYLDVLWAIGRVLVAQGEPEAEDLCREIHGDLGYLDATIMDPEVKDLWFSTPAVQDLVDMSDTNERLKRIPGCPRPGRSRTEKPTCCAF